MKITTKRLAPLSAQVLLDGVPIGRYGGRDGCKWAQLEDGTMVVEDCQLSIHTIKGLIVQDYNASLAAMP